LKVNKKLKVIGIISGTSFDGVDVSYIETDGQRVFAYLGDFFHEHSSNLIEQYKHYETFSIYDIAIFERDVSGAFLAAIEMFCSKHNINLKDIDLIGLHGQTLLHKPEEKLTIQVCNPHIITEALGVDVVADFRRRDIESGGQGAPLVPIYHNAIIDQKLYPANVVNIGGVSNITKLSTNNQIVAFDCGPGNAPLNDFIAQTTNGSQNFDKDGSISNAGKVDYKLIDKILDNEFFKLKGPKSLDRNFISSEQFKHLSLTDGAATICYLVAKAISLNTEDNENIFICGGGRKNPTIMKFLQKLCRAKVHDIDAIQDAQGCNLNGDFIESQAFAFLAARIMNHLPIAYSSTTGTKHPTSGGAFYRA
jgi:anhydro-N-acetylmuramic acid kinase